ncbi:MAG: hypothetical protein ACRC14_07745 [Paracoccaceae bacterium]
MAYLDEKPVAQGEIEFFAVTADHFDRFDLEAMVPVNGHFIVAHSESGHHHVLEREAVEVSRVKDSAGMEILRVLVTTPTAVINLNPHGHKNLPLEPRLYEARISREMGMDDVVRSSRD